MRKLFTLIVLFFSLASQSQELNCLVTINDEQVAGSNKQVFRTLERSITEFVNQKKWTNKNVKPQERINCAMNIIITKRDNNQFEGTIQIQSTRPVYKTSYETPVLNLKDNDFNFKYNEFDQLIYNPTNFDSNLVSMISFYVYVILGMDADTFALRGGEAYFKQAENVMLLAQQSGLNAWANQIGKQNRFQLIDNLLSPNMRQFRSVMYNYHRKGFDILNENKSRGKQIIENNIITLDRLFNKVIGNPMIRLFFDAKADEIVNLYSEGPNTRSKQRMLVVVQKISPNNSSKWQKIN
ncbi:DUF4835 family protein [Pseudotenacibaculum sp. MALMAid0570]|uniref:type IX secretion system protein PorD n=1 Tax=Pseudotenacibaculum sp. MALMAid0570 TaxID=3143938 RepID=UPI0032DFC5DF